MTIFKWLNNPFLILIHESATNPVPKAMTITQKIYLVIQTIYN